MMGAPIKNEIFTIFEIPDNGRDKVTESSQVVILNAQKNETKDYESI